MTSPTVTYDPDVNVLYIQLLDAEGRAIGFEILNADVSLLASVPALPGKAVLRDLLKPHSA